MMESNWIEEALLAFQAGDHARTAELVAAQPQAMLTDPVALMLGALSKPDLAEARALLELGAFELFPAHSNIRYNLGVVEQELGLLEAAMRSYAQTLRLEPAHQGALNNLSDLYRRHGRPHEAWSLVQRYLAAGGSPLGLEVRFAKIADDMGDAVAAEHWFGLAHKRAPEDIVTAWEKAVTDLRDERFGTGWAGYEVRSERFAHGLLGQVHYPFPRWDGSALNGRNLLLHKEQGLGDMIMFASCLQDIARQPSDKVHLAVQPPLVRLFAANFPDCLVWSSVSSAGAPDWRGQGWLGAAGPIDCALPIASLGLVTRREGFPAARAYLGPIDADVDIWRTRLAGLGSSPEALRVGLVICARRDGSSDDGAANGSAKSLAPVLAGRLALTADIEWVGLHDRRTVEDFAHIPGLEPLDTSPWLLDLADTAALIANLDVVVAVDTAVAHLAGAMGKKVLLMLRNRSDWRWGRSRSAAIWYPDVELFRQAREGEWNDVVDAVAQRLLELCELRRKTPALLRAGA